jgi:hypothetical protein
MPGVAEEKSGNFEDPFLFSCCLQLERGHRALSTSSQPALYDLSQNYPNPFNPTTTIRYALSSRSHVTLDLFNTLGQIVTELVNGDLEAGQHEVRVDASGLASGVYFYRLRAGNFIQTKSLSLLR